MSNYEHETFWDRYPAIHFVAASVLAGSLFALAVLAVGFYAHWIWLIFLLGWGVLS